MQIILKDAPVPVGISYFCYFFASSLLLSIFNLGAREWGFPSLTQKLRKVSGEIVLN